MLSKYIFLVRRVAVFLEKKNKFSFIHFLCQKDISFCI